MRYSFLKKIISAMVVLVVVLQFAVFNMSFASPSGTFNVTGSNTSVNVSATAQIGNTNGGGLTDLSRGYSGTVKAGTFSDTVYNTIIIGILQPLIKLLIALSIVFFIWGVFKFMIAEGDKREEGRQFMFWGVVGIFVMVSVWGLVAILTNTFKLDTTGIKIPSIK
jgi:hypothetical protein